MPKSCPVPATERACKVSDPYNTPHNHQLETRCFSLHCSLSLLYGCTALSVPEENMNMPNHNIEGHTSDCCAGPCERS